MIKSEETKMITIRGENAIIEIQIIDITNNPKAVSYYDNFIKCNFYYKNQDVFFTSKNIWINDFELETLYSNLKQLTKNNIENYQFEPDRSVVSIHFFKDQYSSDILLHLNFYLEWESDTLLKSKLRISEEQLNDFIQEIHFLMLHFEGNH